VNRRASCGACQRAHQVARSARTRDAAPGIGEAGQIDKKVRVVSTIEYLLDS
jgi:hypothetical protein